MKPFLPCRCWRSRGRGIELWWTFAVLLCVGICSARAASFLVTNSGDAGPGSLRQAVADAEAGEGDNVIDFDPAAFPALKTITLTGGPIVFAGPGRVVIRGRGVVSVSGDWEKLAFQVTSGAEVTLDGLQITGKIPAEPIPYFETYQPVIYYPATITTILPKVTGGLTLGSSGSVVINKPPLPKPTPTPAPTPSPKPQRTYYSTFPSYGQNATLAASSRSGGIQVLGGALNVTHSTLFGNGTRAISCSGGIVNVKNSTIFGNLGGIAVSGGTVNISKSNISQNPYGAIFISSGSLAVTNSTIAGNFGTLSGGGISASGGAVTLSSTTITGNGASQSSGGGVSNVGATVTVRNSIVAKNGSPLAKDYFGALISQGYNLIGDSSGAVISGDTTGNILDRDPLLGTLADNGGPTNTIALLVGSPAIDAGDPAGAADAEGHMLASDQRGTGYPRVRDGGIGTARLDIGAYEDPGPNTQPRPAQDDFAFFNGSNPIEIDVLANDLPGGIGTARITSVEPPRYGAATVVGGKIRYVPSGLFLAANDSFTYQYSDGNGGIGTATVTIRKLPAMAGKYDGLVLNANKANDRTGYLTLLLSKTGSFTAALVLGGQRYATVSRVVGATGVASYRPTGTLDLLGVNVQLVRRGALEPMTVQFRVDPATDDLHGSVGSTGLDGEPFVSAFTLSAQSARAERAARYLLTMPEPAESPATRPAPTGVSTAVVTIAPAGTVRLAGKLADGSAFSSAGFFHADERFPIYAAIYPGSAAGRGYVNGIMAFPTDLPGGGAEGLLTWFKPPRPKDARFPLGFSFTSPATLAR